MTDITVDAFLYQCLTNLNGGNANIDPNCQNLMIGWAQQEGGGITNGASFNPLNCGYPAKASKTFNNSGVQIYADDGSAIGATVANLQESPYSALVHALITGDLIGLGFQARGAPTFRHLMSTNIAQGLTTWLSGTTNIDAHEDYILAIMHNAGISNPNVEGGTKEGQASGQSQSAIDAYGAKSLGTDTGGQTAGGAVQNALNPLSSFFSNWTQNDILKVVGGVFLILIASVLFIKLQFPSSPIARSVGSFLPGKKTT
jgi:hypothetical protein